MKGRKFSRYAIILGLVMMVFSLLVSQVAAIEKRDVNHEVTLTVYHAPESTPAKDVEFEAYKIADIDENTRFVLFGDFAQYKDVIELEGITNPDYEKLGETLKGFVARDGINPTSVALTDANGKAEFGGIDQGLYLVLGKKYTRDNKTYFFQPSLVCVPALDDKDAWVYNVEITPKYTTEDLDRLKVIKIWTGITPRKGLVIEVDVLCDGEVYETLKLSAENDWQAEVENLENGHEWSIAENTISTEEWRVTVSKNLYMYEIENKGVPFTPEEPTPDAPTPEVPDVERPEIPFTGLIWWPVPLLMSLGFGLFVIGLILRRSDAKE